MGTSLLTGVEVEFNVGVFFALGRVVMRSTLYTVDELHMLAV